MGLFNMRWLPESDEDIGRPARVQSVQNHLVNRAIWASALIGLPAVIASVGRIFVIGWHGSIALHLGLYFIVLGTVWGRHRLTLANRAAVLIGIPNTLAVIDMVNRGFIDMGIPFLMLLILLTTMLFGARYGMLAAIIGLATLIIVASGVCAGAIRYTFDANAYLNAPSSWITTILVSGLIAFIIVGTTGRLHVLFMDPQAGQILTENCGHLERMVKERTLDLSTTNEEMTRDIEERQRLNEQLQASRADLEVANRELETAVFRANQMAADAEIRSYQLEQEIERRRQSEDALRENEEKLVYLAYHDALTGLNNRKAFHEKLKQTIQFARRYRTEIALIYIDIDRFKTVNDSLGHEFGDELLKEIARRLQSSVRETDVLSRIGGDEFTIVLNNPDKINAEIVAARIIETLARPYTLNGVTVDYISASLGISSYPQDAEQIDELIKTADTAMYQAKKDRNRYRRYGS